MTQKRSSRSSGDHDPEPDPVNLWGVLQLETATFIPADVLMPIGGGRPQTYAGGARTAASLFRTSKLAVRTKAVGSPPIVLELLEL